MRPGWELPSKLDYSSWNEQLLANTADRHVDPDRGGRQRSLRPHADRAEPLAAGGNSLARFRQFYRKDVVRRAPLLEYHQAGYPGIFLQLHYTWRIRGDFGRSWRDPDYRKFSARRKESVTKRAGNVLRNHAHQHSTASPGNRQDDWENRRFDNEKRYKVAEFDWRPRRGGAAANTFRSSRRRSSGSRKATDMNLFFPCFLLFLLLEIRCSLINIPYSTVNFYSLFFYNWQLFSMLIRKRMIVK